MSRSSVVVTQLATVKSHSDQSPKTLGKDKGIHIVKSCLRNCPSVPCEIYDSAPDQSVASILLAVSQVLNAQAASSFVVILDWFVVTVVFVLTVA